MTQSGSIEVEDHDEIIVLNEPINATRVISTCREDDSIVDLARQVSSKKSRGIYVTRLHTSVLMLAPI